LEFTMKKIISLLWFAALAVSARADVAPTYITENFVLAINGHQDVTSDWVATGSFSFDSTKTGTLGFGDLQSFNLKFLSFGSSGVGSPHTWSGAFPSYDLAFARANPTGSYFGYSTSANIFVASDPTGYGLMMAAYQIDNKAGFAFDAAGGYCVFSPPVNTVDSPLFNGDGLIQYSHSVNLAPIPIPIPIPEPETYALLLAGLGLMAGAVRRQKKS
jgi:hypothetical protein